MSIYKTLTNNNPSSEAENLAALLREYLPKTILSFQHEVVPVEKGQQASSNQHCAGVVVGAYKGLGDGRQLRRTVVLFIGSTADDAGWSWLQRTPAMATMPFLKVLSATAEKERFGKIVDTGTHGNHILLARDLVISDSNIHSLALSVVKALYG